MTVTQLSVTRKALFFLGDHFDVATTSEASVEAEAIAEIFDTTRKEVLKWTPWNFSTRHAELTDITSTVDGTTLPNLWTYAYGLPADHLKSVHIVNPAGRNANPLLFEQMIVDISAVATEVLLADVIEPELRYIFDQTDLSMVTVEFEYALAHHLAGRAAMAVHGDAETQQIQEQRARAVVSQGIATNANEGVEDPQDAPDWLLARGVGG